MSDHALSCQEAFERLDDYVDRELSPAEALLVAAHLRVCEHCASVFDFEVGVLEDLVEKLNRIRVPEALKDRVAEALDRGARAAGAS